MLGVNAKPRGKRLLIVLILASLLYAGVLLTAFTTVLSSSPVVTIPERVLGLPVSDKADATSVAQLFLRLVAERKYNLACTQVLAAGLVNPCMDDLQGRDFKSVFRIGDSIRVVDASMDRTTAIVDGDDTRPVMKGAFSLGLQQLDQRWLVESFDGTRIVGSP